MYQPAGNAREKVDPGVTFIEVEPPQHLSDAVHRWLTVSTPSPLKHAYRFRALPDACTYLIFRHDDPSICGVTQLGATSEELDLGRQFGFTNVRLLPGVWLGASDHGLIDTSYVGEVPLLEYGRRLHGLPFEAQLPVLTELVERLVDLGLVAANPTVGRILSCLDQIGSVGDMARVAHLSPRQLQRVLLGSVGLAPHDFLKIIRLQQALRDEDHSSYADQSHFIRSFRRTVGSTPGAFARRYDV